MAGEVTVSEMSASDLAASSSVGTPQATTPKRRMDPNDGRSGRTRRQNVEFGMSPGASLPPSTCNYLSINVQIMERGYEFIASSISDLERHQFIRGVYVINNDIIAKI